MQIATARHAASLFAPLLSREQREAVAVAYLDEEQRLIETAVTHGVVDAAELPIRRIIGEALRLNARGLIIAHNHPSGNPSPSAADVAATRRLAGAAAALGLRVHDHLIFAAGRCRSLRALGLL